LTEELHYLPATRLLELFKLRKLSPVELLEAQIDRAWKAEPKINAFTQTFYDQSLVMARKSEARYMRPNARLRALEGLTVAIKDEGAVKGQRSTVGSLLLRDNVAEESDVFNDRILKAGAICHARTATPEFCCAAVTHSRLWGVTRNPWNRDYTPGGSSGGSGAALAAGTTTLASGSDIAGSIRIPASCSGVVGFKPPYGRVPETPGFNLDFYSHEGPLARTVGDVALLENVMAGPHPGDIASLRPKLVVPTSYGSICDWRIAYSLDLGYFDVDEEVRENTREALRVFESMGCRVQHVELDWTERSAKAAWDYLCHIFGAQVAPMLKTGGHLMTPYARAFAEQAKKSKAADFVASLKVASDMYQSFGKILQTCDVFVCPTLAKPAIPADDPMDYDSFREAGKVIPDGLGWCMTYPFNMLSRCPVMSVPSGFASTGVPTGIQIVGRTYDDVRVFKAAGAFEQAAPWTYAADGVPKL
jgi:Asp-tRNA(Asn)/Glu-tRNA(Gln) amidotransferase A subunit family amidase